MNQIQNNPVSLLTICELEILHYVISGKTSQQIAALLYISKQTVDKHRKNMLKKAGVKNCMQLIGRINEKMAFAQ